MSIIELVIEEEVTELVFEQGFEGPPGGGSSTADSLVISTGQLLPTDKRYIYFTPPAGVLGDYSTFDGDQTACELHGGVYDTDNDVCSAGTGFFSNGVALTIRLPDAAVANQVYTLINASTTQEFYVAEESLSYPEQLFNVAASATLEIQKVSGTWLQVIETGDAAGLELGEDSDDAYRGDRGKIAYDHSQTTHNKAFVGLGNVDNTSDANKPVSSATQTALDLKANLAGATFTGPIAGTNASFSGEVDANNAVFVGLEVAGDSLLGTVHAQGLVHESDISYTPTGSTQTIALNSAQNVELNLTSGSGLCTLTLSVPDDPTKGVIVVNQHAVTARDLLFTSSATINWTTPIPTWTAIPLSGSRIVSYYYDGSQFFLSSPTQLEIGTTSGTAYDGASGATLASTVAGLGSTYLALAGGTMTGPIIGASNVLEIRSGATSQTLQVYGTYTDASNYVRAALTSNGTSSVTLAAETAGTGADNIDVSLLPAGTGVIRFGNSVATLTSTATSTNSININGGAGNVQLLVTGTSGTMTFGSAKVGLGNASRVSWHSNNDGTGGGDISLRRVAAGILGIANSHTGTGGGVLEMVEVTAPSAGSANTGRIYLEDNGSGKTRLMIQFASGAAQQIAIEP